ncbi:SHOCT domain-containing protein [Abyssicoccus albus]|uniref:Putative oligomerization/nucleic acid binding protein n=1 Tax=Abyssicoccus albus TaxID=1817405 RepID=A0A3N5BIR2_9BACL|nr:SHOCT domain-containing protein [Abyssicoccus albus]RPF55170.1 putative oligomerization/nucleic acid binding protein [Abyssicoccus albus]
MNNQVRRNKEMEAAKTLTFAAGVVAIIAGVIWCFTGVGLLWAWLDIIGGILFIRSKGFTDEKFASKSTGILVFGLIFLVTSVLGGVLAILAYMKLSSAKQSNDQSTGSGNVMDLEKAYELKNNGVISEEEFEMIKKKTIG